MSAISIAEGEDVLGYAVSGYPELRKVGIRDRIPSIRYSAIFHPTPLRENFLIWTNSYSILGGRVANSKFIGFSGCCFEVTSLPIVHTRVGDNAFPRGSTLKAPLLVGHCGDGLCQWWAR